MNHPLKWILTAGLGATAMYYLDPARGRYRRALVRNRLVHAGHSAKRGAAVVGRDTRNRVLGMAAQMRSRLDFTQPDDAVLVDRIRACLGRAVTHPHSVHVEARDGVVTLSGPILEREVPLLIDCVLGVRGVKELRDELESHTTAGRVPGLQGTPPPRRTGERAALMERSWSPALRAGSGLLGTIAALGGFRHRGLSGTLIGAGGLLLSLRAATNLELRRVVGIGASRHAVEVHKSIRIQAPVEQVFELWDDFEQFPRFMAHVRSVRPVHTEEDHDRWRWTMTGPTGMRFEFDSVLTAREENRLLAWRTCDGAFVQHAGRVTFHDNDDGSTTVDVNMVYNPVIGAVGHAVAWLLGADPKRQMDDDLLRMKTFLETGKPPRDAAEQQPPVMHRRSTHVSPSATA